MNFTGERFIPNLELLNDDIGYEHLHRYYSVAPLLKGKRVLDIACGEGYGAVIIAKFAASVVGVDIDAEAIQLAKLKYGTAQPNVFFEQGDATKIPCKDDLFDVVVSFETIEHLSVDMQQTFMVEIKRVLLPNGVLIMSTPDKKNYSERFDQNNPFHLHEFDKEEYTSFLKDYFNHLIIYDQGFEVVSIISNASIENATNVNIYNWQQPSQNNGSRKYMIAIAANEPLAKEYETFNSVVPNVNKDYLYLMERLVKMNEEIEALGKWGHSLDSEIKLLELNKKNSTVELGLLKTNENKLNADLKFQRESITEKEKEINIQQNKIADQEAIIKIQGLEIEFQEEEIEFQKNEITGLKNTIASIDENTKQLKQQIEYLELELIELKKPKEPYLAARYKKIKRKYLSNDSPASVKINSFFNKFKKKKKLGIIKEENAAISLAEENEGDGDLKQNIDFDETLVLPYYLNPLVSIIIPAFNGWEMNYKCIKSIIENTETTAYEVILADDCSTDKTKDCSTYIKNIVHVRNAENVGFLENCNNASLSAKGEYILFLNNDTEVTPDWLSSLVDLIKSDDKIGMVGSKLIYPDWRLQEAGGIIWKDASGWNYGNKQTTTAPEYNYVKEVDYISGACILLRKNLWQQIGGFDKIYSPAYYEDVDLAFTLRKMGYKVIYQPLSQVIHYEGFSHGTEETLLADSTSIKSLQLINKKVFYKKWKSALLQDQFRNAQNAFNARDRSANKKTIVVIDHYVPHFDKDAGSKATFQYLELFVSLGLNVKFIGDNFYKHEPYTTALQQIGIEVLFGNWYHDNWKEWIVENSKKIDFFYLIRPHVAIKYIDFIKENTNAKILFMIVDLHFLREQRRYEIEKNVESLQAFNQFKELELSIFAKSNTCLTFSSVEKAVINSLDPSFNLETIPLYCFKQNAIAINNFNKRKDILFIGGFGHTPNIDAVQWFCQEIWPIIKTQNNSINFIIAGSNPPDEILALEEESVQVKGFVTNEELENLYSSIKLVVVPLRYGAGIKGKTVGSMYKGIPIVSTSIGIEGMEGDYREFLHPFDDAQSFADEVVSLYTDEERLIDMSFKETEYINQYFTVESAAEKMKAILGL